MLIIIAGAFYKFDNKEGYEMKRKLFAILLILALVFSLAACNKTQDNSPAAGDQGTSASPGNSAAPSESAAPGGSAAPGNSAAPADPGKMVEITAAFSAVPNSLDPVTEDTNLTMSICFHIYDKLFELDAITLERIPGVAKSWKEIDAMNWEFEIDLDMKFQNGDPLTMDDVVYSFTRLLDFAKSADTGKQIASITYEGNILKMVATEENAAIIPRAVATAAIVNKAYIEANGDDAIYLNPIGTGPYKVAQFTPGDIVVLETWDGYPYAKPQIDKITFVQIPEAQNRYIAVESGQVQYAALVTQMEMNLAEDNNSLGTLQVPTSNRILAFGFNCERAPFDNINVRRGILHAVDRNSFVALNGGGRTAMKGLLFPGFDTYYSDPPGLPEYDMAKAKELLEGEGINPSNPLDVVLLYFPQNADPGLEMVQSSLKSLGVNLILDLVEFSVYLTREGPGEFDMFYTSLPNRGGHPLTDLDRFDYSFVGSRDLVRWQNAEYQELATKIRASTDLNEQLTLIAKANEILGYEAPEYGVFVTPINCVMDNKLSGVTVRADLIQSLRNATYTG